MLIIFLGCVTYAYKVISDINIAKIAAVEPRADKVRLIQFEEGGLLKKEDLKFFYSKTSDKRFFNIISKSLSESNENYEVIKNVDLEPLIPNDCSRSRCLQYRLPFSSIPHIFSKGLIGIEDYRFLNHFGIDLKSIFRAIIQDIKAGSFVQGGSTLTQQVVKNLFYTNEKSVQRKVKEAIVAIYLETFLDKTTILQTYFNEVYWGSLGGVLIKGIESASRNYFNKNILDITSYEVSILISMLKGPNYYNPIRRTQRLRDRADFIYKKLKKLDFIASNDKSMWDDEDWADWVSFLEYSVEMKYQEALYLTLKRKESTDQYLIFNSILRAKKLLEEKDWKDNSYSVKMVIGDSTEKEFYYSRFERDIEKAIKNEYVQVGSTLKPLVYEIYVNNGAELDQKVSVEPLTLDLLSGKWTPRESHKMKVSEVSIARALRESLNIPVIRLAQSQGFDVVEKKLKVKFPRLLTPLSQYPSQLLGALELSVDEVFEAYKGFFERDCIAGKSSITEVLSNPKLTTIKYRVGKRLGGQRFFGKTGTSNQGLDNWFIGYDGRKLFVIWFGVDGDRSGIKDTKTYGSNTAFLIYRDSVLYSGRRLAILPCL